MNLEIEACQDFQNSVFGVNQADNGPASHAQHNFMCLLTMQQMIHTNQPTCVTVASYIFAASLLVVVKGNPSLRQAFKTNK